MSHAVKVYKHSRFRGRSRQIEVGNYASVRSLVGNDEISSIRVAEGFYAKFYEHSGFRGKSIILFAGDYAGLPGWNDKISSIQVFPHNKELFPLVEFYEHNGFRGYKQTLAGTGPDTEYDFPFFVNDSISSLKVPPATTVIFYKDSRLRGEQREFTTGEYPSLSTFGWNDKASSVKILRPDLKLVNIEYLEETELQSGEPIAISSSTVNRTDLVQKASLSLTREITESSTRSWSNSTMVGLSVSTTSTVGASGKVLSAEVSTTITATLENTFTIGEEESRSKSVLFQKVVNFDIAPQTIGRVSVTLTPKKYRVKVRYTFQLEGTDTLVTEDAEIHVSAYQRGEAVIEAAPLLEKV